MSGGHAQPRQPAGSPVGGEFKAFRGSAAASGVVAEMVTDDAPSRTVAERRREASTTTDLDALAQLASDPHEYVRSAVVDRTDVELPAAIRAALLNDRNQIVRRSFMRRRDVTLKEVMALLLDRTEEVRKEASRFGIKDTIGPGSARMLDMAALTGGHEDVAEIALSRLRDDREALEKAALRRDRVGELAQRMVADRDYSAWLHDDANPQRWALAGVKVNASSTADAVRLAGEWTAVDYPDFAAEVTAAYPAAVAKRQAVQRERADALAAAIAAYDAKPRGPGNVEAMRAAIEACDAGLLLSGGAKATGKAIRGDADAALAYQRRQVTSERASVDDVFAGLTKHRRFVRDNWEPLAALARETLGKAQPKYQGPFSKATI